MRIVITDIGERDSFYCDRDKVIGLVGEVDESKITAWGDCGWFTIYMVPNPLSCQLLGLGSERLDTGEICFFEAKYRKGE
jgi:hypothetical protein